ncbi:MAG: recombinase family protein [Hyphomonas sp.]
MQFSYDQYPLPNGEGSCAIGYARVSTLKQKEGVGLVAQQAAIQAYAKAAGCKVLEVVEEDHSATDSSPLQDRAGFKRALDLALLHDCPILVSRMDRLSRNGRAYEDFIRSYNVMVIPVCEVHVAVLPGQRARIAEAQAVAEFKAARQSAAFDRKRNSGEPLGNPAPSPLTHKASAEARRRYFLQRVELILGVMDQVGHDVSRPALAAALNERGLRTSSGEEWNKANLRRYHVEAKRLIAERGVSTDAEQEEDLSKLPGYGIY